METWRYTMEEKTDNNKAWIDEFEQFFIDYGYHFTQKRYGLPNGYMKYYLYRLGYQVWRDKEAHVRCYYNNRGDMVWRGHVTEKIRNKFYDFRLEQIRDENMSKALWRNAYAEALS